MCFREKPVPGATAGYVLPPEKDIPKTVHKPQLPVKPPKKVDRVDSMNRPGARPPPPPKNLPKVIFENLHFRTVFGPLLTLR